MDAVLPRALDPVSAELLRLTRELERWTPRDGAPREDEGMTQPDNRCQCKRWPDVDCCGRMTQEDLLCDLCRDGCHLVAIGGQPPGHVRVTGFKYKLVSVPVPHPG